jgi:cytochrome c-type biogenesis protein CcmH/NrfF
VRAAVAVLVALAALVGAGAASAADCTKTSVSDLEDEVMCPVCGTSLGLAREAPQARRERAYIVRLVKRCRSKDEIKAALVAQFGDSVLAVPSKDGFNLSAYVVPLVAMLLAGGALIIGLVRWRWAGPTGARAAAALASSRGIDPADAARLDDELRRDER